MTKENLKQEFIKNFGKEKWNQEEMLEKLAPYEKIITQELIIERLPIIVEEIQEDSRLDLKNLCIIISSKKIKNKKEALKCLVHEYRHYYQLAIVGNNQTEHPFYDLWKESLQSYNETSTLTPEELEETYITNPLEIDSFAYTKYYFQKHLNQDLLCFPLEIELILDAYIDKYISKGL